MFPTAYVYNEQKSNSCLSSVREATQTSFEALVKYCEEARWVLIRQLVSTFHTRLIMQYGELSLVQELCTCSIIHI